MRVILFTGKGGVGKTSIAAATALRSAEMGKKTVVFSADMAHSLADSLDVALGHKPMEVQKNLWAQEINILEEMEENWGKIQGWLSEILRWEGLSQVVADELTIFPGMEELFSLLQIKSFFDEGSLDVVVVDCAPTGDTLRLLSFPEVARWWLEKLFPIQKKFTRVARPILQPLIPIRLPSDEIFNSVETLFKSLQAMQGILADRNRSSVRLVVNAEKMVVKEAQRTFTSLNLFGYLTDAVIVNRLLPEVVTDQYFGNWRRLQKRYYKMVEERFSPLPILTAPLFNGEVVGRERLSQLAESLYGEDDPTRIMYSSSTQKVKKQESGYLLTLSLPFANKEAVSMVQSGEELIVRVGSYKRAIMLPRTLMGLEATNAKMEGDKLLISFGGVAS